MVSSSNKLKAENDRFADTVNAMLCHDYNKVHYFILKWVIPENTPPPPHPLDVPIHLLLSETNFSPLPLWTANISSLGAGQGGYHRLLARFQTSLAYPHYQRLLRLSRLLVVYVLHARRIGQKKSLRGNQ
jgi:hypothetical protein